MGWMEDHDKALTAGEMIERLQQLPPDTVLFTSHYDDWAVGNDSWTEGIRGVSDEGCVERGRMLRAWDSFSEREQ